MIDYNIVLYIGVGLIVFGFVLFLVASHFERQAEIKLFKLEQAYKKAKEKEIKTWTTTDTSGDTTIWVGRK